MRPIVIGHRGASGYRPEHTLASYALSARLGADYIEPDLVSTGDGVLVARHENEISGTTDVAERPEFAARRATKEIDGRERTGWFTEDFTLVELRTLRARERIPDVRQRNTLYDGRYPVPTFAEIVGLAQRLTAELGRPIGVYPETKTPTYFRSIGLALEGPLVEQLRVLDGVPVFVQSFEADSLGRVREAIDVPLVQLLGRSATPDLAAVARHADAVGPAKELCTAQFVEAAHAVGLEVHPFTFRNENRFLPPDLRRGDDPDAWGDAIGEYERYFALGVDGVFSDYADTAVEARGGVTGAR